MRCAVVCSDGFRSDANFNDGLKRVAGPFYNQRFFHIVTRAHDGGLDLIQRFCEAEGLKLTIVNKRSRGEWRDLADDIIQESDAAISFFDGSDVWVREFIKLARRKGLQVVVVKVKTATARG